MDSRSQFAGRFRKDLSVDNLRVKMGRRKSMSQKENRHQEFGKSRCLRLMDPNTSALEEISETPLSQCHENSAVLGETGSKAQGELNKQRHKMLQRYKEEKLLRKLKEQRENPQKSTFRCGVYKPDEKLPSLPSVRNVAKSKDKQPLPTTRVTRSAARAEALPTKTTRRQPVGAGNPSIRASEPAARGHGQVQATKTAVKENQGKFLLPSRQISPLHEEPGLLHPNVAVKAQKKTSKVPKSQEITQEPKAVSVILAEEHKTGEASNKSVKNDPASDPPEPRQRIASFAPDNFTFKPLDGLCSYRLRPMTPGTANKFLSFTWSPARLPSGNVAETPGDAIEVCEAEVRLPSFHVTSPECPPPAETTQKCTTLPQAGEPQHDEPYFRHMLRSEIQRLTSLCAHWDERIDMEVPDEAKDLIRTTVGQTRLLVSERFKQFEGLVDNCEFKRGEKETTCTDLDGFWDMVYFQIEDVIKKFANLGKLEENSWQQSTVQPKKAVKKRSAPVAKPNSGDQARVAARSRLAAIKAAMKKGRVLEEVAGAAAADQADLVVFDAGFFQVQSPAKQPSGMKAKRGSLQASALCMSPVRAPPAAPSSALADEGSQVTPGVKSPVGKTLFGAAVEDWLNKQEPHETSRHLFINKSHPVADNLVRYLVPPEECNLVGSLNSFDLETSSQGKTRIHSHILSKSELEDEVFTCDSEGTEQQMHVITSLAEARSPAAQTPDYPGRSPPTDMGAVRPRDSPGHGAHTGASHAAAAY